MSDFEPRSTAEPAAPEAVEPAPRKRPKPGERRVQILQALAAMLEQPGADRVTTAALAARLDVSEAALYRHFASKAQMFEGLIEFIENAVFSLINQIVEREAEGAAQAQAAAAPAAAQKDTTAELQKLADLHKQGVLTDEEFAAMKKKLLGL